MDVPFEKWLARVPRNIREDRLWQCDTYRIALYLADLAWDDSAELIADPRGRSLAWQLIASAGSISANIEEGFGRGYGRDYARFLRIALGSAREARGWYFRGRHVIPRQVLEDRLGLLDQIIAGLVITARQQRSERGGR